MHFKQKYVVTEENKMIVFPELFNHKDFADWNPISAGFISIWVKMEKANNCSYPIITCTCYGESFSLKLKSRPEEDARLAEEQILGNGY